MTFYYKLTEVTDHSKWYLLFHFGTLSFAMSVLYHLITFVCIFTADKGLADRLVLDIYAPVLPHH